MGYALVKEMVNLASEKNISIAELVLSQESAKDGNNRDGVFAQMFENWQIMKASIDRGLNEAPHSKSGLVGGDGKKIYNYANANTLSGAVMMKAVGFAVATAEVNASMGRIVACPTAGSCGIVPAVLKSVQNSLNLSDEEVTMGLFTAAGIGGVIAHKASVAGAVGGCQAECGSAAAMAAAAAVELSGGSPQMAADAAAMVIKNVLGLVCDPVAGLVEVPCVKRNAMGASLALVCADMALAGVSSRIPVDETIVAMDEVGKALPSSLKETALGGLATTPTGLKCAKNLKA